MVVPPNHPFHFWFFHKQTSYWWGTYTDGTPHIQISMNHPETFPQSYVIFRIFREFLHGGFLKWGYPQIFIFAYFPWNKSTMFGVNPHKLWIPVSAFPGVLHCLHPPALPRQPRRVPTQVPQSLQHWRRPGEAAPGLEMWRFRSKTWGKMVPFMGKWCGTLVVLKNDLRCFIDLYRMCLRCFEML